MDKGRITLVTLLICFLSFIVWFFIKVWEPPIREGTVIKKQYQKETLRYKERVDEVYRTDYYTDTEYYTNSNGHRSTRTVRRNRQVFDYYQYAVYEYFDGQDFIIQLSKSSEKIENKLLKRTVYVTKNFFDKLNTGDYYKTFKENGDSFKDNNNYTKRVTRWTRFRHDMSSWRNKEY